MRGDPPRIASRLRLLQLLVVSAILVVAHSRTADSTNAITAVRALSASQSAAGGAAAVGVQPAARRLNAVTAKNWAELKSLCEAGGNDITLSQTFDASSYPGEINFSGKSCVIRGSGQTFDLNKTGRFLRRFAYANGAGSSLELHGLTIMNGQAHNVSDNYSFWVRMTFREHSSNWRGASHTTQF